MYNNLIEEDIMILDNEFFKIDTMFESVDKMYDIKQRELEYNYIYTESINEEFVDLYTEAEEAKSKNEQGLLGRLFTAILNFIRSIRAKILRLFGNDKKASELEAKIKGNPKLANQTVEITNTTDAEKAIDEGTSFFGSLIDKIVKGTATEADADAAEEKNKSLLSRIAIFGGGALLAAGGAKVANDKLHIIEKLGNLLKREEDTKKKSIEVTQTNEQIVQKGEQALKNNSQSGNEENTKAGRRIMGSFKDFITGAGKFFTGKASELKSRFSSSSSSNDEEERDFNHECQLNINLLKRYNEHRAEITEEEQKQINEIKDKIKNKKCTENDVNCSNKIVDDVGHRYVAHKQKSNDKTKPEDKVEKQPETSTTDTTEQKNGKNNENKTEDKVEKQPETKSDNQDHELSPKEKMDDEIKILLNTFRAYTSSGKDGPATLSLKERYIDNGKSIVSPEDRSKIDFSTGSSMSPKNTVEIAKRFLDSYSIYSKYKNPDKNKVKEVLKNICGDDYEDDLLDEEMNDIKTTFTALDKCAKELNELIKKRETFKESSYDLINDILTIFENSF